MASKPKRDWWRVLGLLLVGTVVAVLAVKWYRAQQVQRVADERSWRTQRQQDRAALEARTSGPVTPRVLQVGQHELLVVDVPVMPEFGRRMDYRRCFVWRDAEYRAASMACGKEDLLKLED